MDPRPAALQQPPRPNDIPPSIWQAAWAELLADCPPPWGLYDDVQMDERFPIFLRHPVTGGMFWADEAQAQRWETKGWVRALDMRREKIGMGQF